jgi:hypothetical protein
VPYRETTAKAMSSLLANDDGDELSDGDGEEGMAGTDIMKGRMMMLTQKHFRLLAPSAMFRYALISMKACRSLILLNTHAVLFCHVLETSTTVHPGNLQSMWTVPSLFPAGGFPASSDVLRHIRISAQGTMSFFLSL